MLIDTGSQSSLHKFFLTLDVIGKNKECTLENEAAKNEDKRRLLYRISIIKL